MDTEKIRNKWKPLEEHKDSTLDYAICDIYSLCTELDKHRWIPVEEGVPKDSGYYQVIREQNGWPTTRVFHAGNRQQWDTKDIVSHWKTITLPKD